MAQAAATFSLLNTDKISTMMGAPPHHWKVNEVQQIKHIQRCFRNAYSHRAKQKVKLDDHRDDDQALQITDEMTFVVEEDQNTKPNNQRTDDEEKQTKKDAEFFLPRDSPLRSKNGEHKVPANPVFKDYEAFLNSCKFDFWREHFEGDASDKFLNENAESIVSGICQAQSRNQLRVKNGHVPLRKKREHITPLALVLHEIKLWATNTLRTADITSEETFREIDCRVRYLDGLSQKEVWGDTALKFTAGMNSTAHHKLFRVFLSLKEGLEKAYDYAVRGYNRNSSREKLARLGNLLKEVVMNEMKMVSNRMVLTKKIEDSKVSRLQITDLFKSIENLNVDVQNMVNVLLWRLCQVPLFRAALNGDYDKAAVKESVQELSNWSKNNLFCIPSDSDDRDAEPDYRMDQRRELRLMPEVYRPTAAQLKRQQKAVDPSALGPLPAKNHIAILKKCFQNERTASRVIKLVMRNLAAIQEIIPSMYAIHQLWSLAGDGGDYTVYDTMRQEVIRVMTDAVKRVESLKSVGVEFNKVMAQLVHEKKEQMRKEAIQKKKLKVLPPWVANHSFIRAELSATYDLTYNNTFARLYEIAKDAKEYTLTTEVLDDKVVEAKKVFDAITGHTSETVKPNENVNVKVSKQKADSSPQEKWGHEDDIDSVQFGNQNAYDDKTSTFNFDDGESFNPFAQGYESDDYH